VLRLTLSHVWIESGTRQTPAALTRHMITAKIEHGRRRPPGRGPARVVQRHRSSSSRAGAVFVVVFAQPSRPATNIVLQTFPPSRTPSPVTPAGDCPIRLLLMSNTRRISTQYNIMPTASFVAENFVYICTHRRKDQSSSIMRMLKYNTLKYVRILQKIECVYDTRILFARTCALHLWQQLAPSSSPLSQFLPLTPQNLPLLQLFPPVV